MTKESVVIEALWRIIKAQSDGMKITADLIEYLFDVIPQSEKPAAAARLDDYHALLKASEELIAPIRQIMEG